MFRSLGQQWLKLDPPLFHMSALVTGGLRQIYGDIQSRKRQFRHASGAYTNKLEAFLPQVNMPLMALRYSFIEVIANGRSSVLITAADTFRGGSRVAVKVLHGPHYALGAQEVHCLQALNAADPWQASATVRLLNTFIFDDHFCIVFELLRPEPISFFLKDADDTEVIRRLRKVAVKLLSTLGFLQQQNVAHADLKPDNILLTTENDFTSVKVIDFGNALYCIHKEVSLYYNDFDLQTPLYRAPEVMFGVPFGSEIDMYSLGCVLAELYLGKPLFFGKNKEAILSETVELLGAFPMTVFQRGKYFSLLQSFTLDTVMPQIIRCKRLMTRLKNTRNFAFATFIEGMLAYDPRERLTPCGAACHPFLASEVAIGYLMPSAANKTQDGGTYTGFALNRDNYATKPHIDKEVERLNLNSLELLHRGTVENLTASPSTTTPCGTTDSKTLASSPPLLGDLRASAAQPMTSKQAATSFRPSGWSLSVGKDEAVDDRRAAVSADAPLIGERRIAGYSGHRVAVEDVVCVKPCSQASASPASGRSAHDPLEDAGGLFVLDTPSSSGSSPTTVVNSGGGGSLSSSNSSSPKAGVNSRGGGSRKSNNSSSPKAGVNSRGSGSRSSSKSSSPKAGVNSRGSGSRSSSPKAGVNSRGGGSRSSSPKAGVISRGSGSRSSSKSSSLKAGVNSRGSSSCKSNNSSSLKTGVNSGRGRGAAQRMPQGRMNAASVSVSTSRKLFDPAMCLQAWEPLPATPVEGEPRLTTSDKMRARPTSSGKARPPGTTSDKARAWPTTPDKVPIRPMTSDKVLTRLTTSDKVLTRPTTSNQVRTRPMIVDKVQTRPTTSDKGRTRPTTSDIVLTRPTTSDKVRTQLMTSDKVRTQPTTSEKVLTRPTIIRL
ncbi:PREDICTED: dual specificity tyrosine-phosphorylation-regulated kinase 1A-like [Priapulus caudatus]|uniref:Dual specificity tyrosine-phosphorylation-regulated kinase 1A-like n=1 Tax=Priapulus caudatus TaxID=37621 RepID=A0ABM1EWX9_PRICU|nr:PREDICTED: dual specificity tyrosine-phosphorylation-regulated kinase 1A-like [Priapulus caudatus]